MGQFNDWLKNKNKNLDETSVEYDGFLQKIRREFDTPEQAAKWLRKIGRPDLIRKIIPQLQQPPCPTCGGGTIGGMGGSTGQLPFM